MSNIPSIPVTSHHRIELDGVHVFYRETGPVSAPVVLLLHEFPTFQCDIPDAIVTFLPTCHFALETHLEKIVAAMRSFLVDSTH